MKKTMRRMKALLMAVLVTAVFSGFGSASPEAAAIDLAIPAPEESLPAEVQEAMDRQVPALDAYEALQSCLTANTRSAEVLQPWHAEEYGGEYIDGDRLVIQLVDRTPAMESRYRSLCGDSPNVVFEDVRYTLDELEALDSTARELCDSYDIVSFGADRRNNTYLINVLDEDYEALLEDERVVQSGGKIQVEKSGPAVTCAQAVWGGDKLNAVSSNGAVYSACIGGTYGGSPSLLTAGHGLKVGQTVYKSGSAIGSVVYVRANETMDDTSVRSLGDFSIIKLNSNYSASNRVRKSNSTITITGTYSSVPVGTTIYKYGTTTGDSWGSVSQVNVTVRYGEPYNWKYYIRGLYGTNMQNSSGTSAIGPGDSGGTVYTKSGSSYQLHGCVSGYRTDTNGNSTNMMYSAPIGYATAQGFYPKTS